MCIVDGGVLTLHGWKLVVGSGSRPAFISSDGACSVDLFVVPLLFLHVRSSGPLDERGQRTAAGSVWQHKRAMFCCLVPLRAEACSLSLSRACWRAGIECRT